MIKKFVLWFICFGLSFLIESWGWTDQGRAFLYIDLFAIGAGILLFVILSLIPGEQQGIMIGFTSLSILAFAGIAAVTLFATWGATKLFDIDFFVAYQVMTFGQCLCIKESSDD